MSPKEILDDLKAAQAAFEYMKSITTGLPQHAPNSTARNSLLMLDSAVRMVENGIRSSIEAVREEVE